ncbi:HAD family hydrolase [Glycomyces paridis]|uniref:HAD family phosphatase n=1 Tax=Glycomyces paridis TaxID=2126555 RepID=A0A4S8PA62_9ACTN|nr:HAD family hydrolase [Glycomyces paridis]THV26032.1 HAD family phosphatase [Glycomyces paridis]
MLKPRVIASDLDGTLLAPGGELSARTRDALAAARANGMSVVAVTARTSYGVDMLPDLIPLLDGAICANGAILYHPTTGRIRILRSIRTGSVRKVAAAIAKRLPDALFAVETGTGVIGDSRYQALVGPSNWEFVDGVETVFKRAKRAVKLKVYCAERTGEEMAAAVADADLGGLAMCHWGDFGMLDFNARGADKAFGLAYWCKERRLGPDAVVAFGDMPNDAPMLSWAARSYAMGDAHPEAIAAATDRTASNAEDGVAQVIEALLADDDDRADETEAAEGTAAAA